MRLLLHFFFIVYTRRNNLVLNWCCCLCSVGGDIAPMVVVFLFAFFYNCIFYWLLRRIVKFVFLFVWLQLAPLYINFCLAHSGQIISGPSVMKPRPTRLVLQLAQTKQSWCQWRSSNEMKRVPPIPRTKWNQILYNEISNQSFGDY